MLTMLLAHMCSEHDATPRTFVEQVGEVGASVIRTYVGVYVPGKAGVQETKVKKERTEPNSPRFWN